MTRNQKKQRKIDIARLVGVAVLAAATALVVILTR